MKITKKLYISVNKVFKRLSLLRRWTTDMADTSYAELGKQGLNAIITYFLAREYELAGNKLDWSKFPKIALYRAFEKAYITYDVSNEEIDEICKIGNIPNGKDDILVSIIGEKADDMSFAYELCDANSGAEKSIFTAARSIGTYIEMKENRLTFNGEYSNMIDELIRKMANFESLPGFKRWSNPESNEFKILQKISKLRHQVRWIAYAHQKDCSVLGHLFDTGIFAYLMSMEENDDEEVATKMFFIGVFHDIPEAWTKDIPSPMKEKMGIRAATEAYELKMVEENIYAKLHKEMANYVKTVMMEDGENAFVKPLLKGADYLSATRECFLQIQSGSRDSEFYRAAHDLTNKIKDKKARITPVAMEFYSWIISKVDRVKDSFIFESDE